MSFHEALDVDARSVVWLMTGRTNSDADYQAYVDSIRKLDDLVAGQDGAAIFVVDPGNPPPPSQWRKAIADASSHLKSKPVFALVSTSQLVRGVMTAINWIRPPSYPHLVASTTQEAFAWAEAQLARPLPLERLLADARAQAATHADVPRS